MLFLALTTKAESLWTKLCFSHVVAGMHAHAYGGKKVMKQVALLYVGYIAKHFY